MGLDQSWLIEDGKGGYTDFAYHRKFNALEGFMANEWAAQGNDKVFNCELLEITPELLEKLELEIKSESLNPTAGFFFGSTDKDEWYRKDMEQLTGEVLPQVKQFMEQGRKVFYSSWW